MLVGDKLENMSDNLKKTLNLEGLTGSLYTQNGD